MIELVDVTIRRDESLVVDRLSLVIRTGRAFWIIGPNGAGKSSLLRVLAGLARPDSGQVLLRSPNGRPPLYCHSEMRIPATATVRDWHHLTRRLLPADAARVRTALLPEVEGRRRVARLSTGERKRLLLDTLLRCPGPLLLDEPFEHLSPDAKTALREHLRERARWQPVVVATNQGTHRARDDGGILLKAGNAVALGAGREATGASEVMS